MKKLLIALLIAPYLSFSQSNFSLNFQNSNYLLLPDEFEVLGTDGVTFSFWMNSGFPENHENYIVDMRNTQAVSAGNGATRFVISKWSNQPLVATFEYSYQPNNPGYSASFDIDSYSQYLNTWIYLSVVFFDSGHVEIYINGNIVSSNSCPPVDFKLLAGAPSCCSSKRIGAEFHNNWQNYEGLIDEFAIWNKTLNSNEIQQYMNCSPIGSESGLSGFWKIENGTGTVVNDLTVNNNHGEFVNNTSNFWNSNVPAQSCIAGCTDSLAWNWNSSAVSDDGSCIYFCSSPTNLQLQSTIENSYDRCWVNWNEMSSLNDSVTLYKILYRPIGSNVWLIKQKTYDGNQTPIVRTRLQNLSAGTSYEMKIRAFYNSGCESSFSPISYFATLDTCLNVGSFAVTTPNPTRATFTWDDSNGSYSFVRIKSREDISPPLWFNVGGVGVSHGVFTKNKNHLSAGASYTGQARTWCNPNGGAYKSPTWTPLVYWTQPNLRVDGGKTIKNLTIYPNPSRNVFNITFTSKSVQELRVRLLNVVGEEIVLEELQEFVGEYTKQINLENNAKGIYFLEIETNDGIINKKLVLQ